MQLPNNIIPYLKGLLITQNRYTFTWISRLLGNISHDKLNRALRLDYSLQGITVKIIKTILKIDYPVTVSIDETTLDKVFAKHLEGAGYIYSSKSESVVFGYAWVVLSIRLGNIAIPLYWRRYNTNDKSTRIDLAIDMLKELRNSMIPVKEILFDSFYAANKVFKLIDDYGWTFCTQIKRNRLLNGRSVSKIRPNIPYWTERGRLSGGTKVTIAKHRGKYFCTNAWFTDHREIIEQYQRRWEIEELFRFAHSQIGLSSCQARTLEIQVNHFSACMLLVALLSIESFNEEKTLYEIKDCIVLNEYTPKLLLLKEILNTA